jgi:hypothetical protein
VEQFFADAKYYSALCYINSNFYFSYGLWGSGLCGKLVDWIDGREEIVGTWVIYTTGDYSWRREV